MGTNGVAFACSSGDTAGSVDGRELVFDDSTKYDSELRNADNRWSGLGRVDVRPDDAWTYADVDVYDVYDQTGNFLGRWVRTAVGADDIEMNDYFLNGPGNQHGYRDETMTHEFGHALRLGHIDHVDAMMDGCNRRNIWWITPHDEAYYRRLWG